MNRKQNTYTWVLAVALTALASSSLPARAAGPRTSPNQVTVTVTVIPKQGNRADLTAQDVLVYQNQERRPVIDWKPADSASPLDLAILMDDSLASDVFHEMQPVHAEIHQYVGRAGGAWREHPNIFVGRQHVLRQIAA